MKKIDLYAQIQEKTGICSPSGSNFMGSSCTKFEAYHHCHGETFALYSLLAIKFVKIRYDFHNFESNFQLSNIKKKHLTSFLPSSNDQKMPQKIRISNNYVNK
jgi:hypothetical protein